MTSDAANTETIEHQLTQLERRVTFIGYLLIALFSGAFALHAEAVIPGGWAVSKEVAGWAADAIFLGSAVLLTGRFKAIG